jgi:hypothetical protein
MLTTKRTESYDIDEEERIDSLILPHEYAVNADVDIMAETVQNQLDNLNSVSKKEDKLSSLVNTLDNLKKNITDPDSKKIVQDFLDDMLRNVVSSIEKNLGTENSNSFNLIKDLKETEFRDFSMALYEFFIVNRQENIERYLLNKIILNYKELTQVYKEQIDRKDIVAKSDKKKFKNSPSFIIANKLDDIIRDIVTSEEEDEFLELVVKDNEDEWCNAIIMDEFDTIFVPKLRKFYFGDILDISGEDSFREISLELYREVTEHFKPSTQQG